MSNAAVKNANINSKGDSKIGKLASCLTSKERTDPSFWNKFCHSLSIEGKATAEPITSTIPLDESTRWKNKLVSSGYVLVDECMDAALIKRLAEGIEQLHEVGLPATFIFLFDETWDLARASRSILKSSSHSNNDFNFDLLAWFVEAGKGGFSPHRDRQPEDAASTFYPDGQAKFLTHWIALSEASPENSCLHVIPKTHDPGYINGDNDSEDPLRRALPDKESFQHIRALPRKPGQSILFTHRIIHWGSKNDPDSAFPPRIAISFVCSNPSYESPLLKADYFVEERIPPFHIRLLLVCAQLLIYYQRFDLNRETIKACYEYCKQYEEDLEENYRRKVFVEFVKAMKESGKSSNDVSEKSSGVKLVITEEEDEEDAMMEEMLNAESGGYGDFQDDYDELEDEENIVIGSEEEEEGMDEEEEEMDLFGKRTLVPQESSAAKKIKVT